jgi:predicted DNA repair protein MutK
MAGASLLLLLDDIAAVLDDVAVMTKIAARKTAAVLGDDLAVNADKVTGVRANRELPVVWAVAKGSMRNKLILVPAAMLVSVVANWLITPLLVLGGLYLCYEGFEKVAHRFMHSEEEAANSKALSATLADPNSDMVAFENEKIRGAIRTDMILSGEIIVITLGVVVDSGLVTQFFVVATIAFGMTIGVYGLVAGIVKLDDGGLYLTRSKAKGLWGQSLRWVGVGLVNFAPMLMKGLTIVGTIAMFMVGGGILSHEISVFHHGVEAATAAIGSWNALGAFLQPATPTFLSTLLGVVAGAIIVTGFELWEFVRR